MAHDWGYSGQNGPSHWTFGPNVTGHHQSPIVISPSEARYDKVLSNNPLELNYNTNSLKIIKNTGHTVVVTAGVPDCKLAGGPLQKNDYILAQFHFHWGSVSTVGSEHKIDDKTYAAELHLVHWNSTEFASFDDALQHVNGLCVLTVFIEAGATDHQGLEALTKLLPAVTYADEQVELPDGFDPRTILPADLTNYWTYQGSLTTPPCNESVRFIIFRQPITVSERQLAAFRALKTCTRDGANTAHCCPLGDNYRPTQPLNDRQVTASFRKFFT